MTTTYFAQGRVIFRFSTDAIDSPRAPAQKVTRAETQIVCPMLSQYLAVSAASLTTSAVAMKNALFWAIKISEFGEWIERHNGDHVINVAFDDVTGDRKVAQPSRVHATESVALATRWRPSGWVKS